MQTKFAKTQKKFVSLVCTLSQPQMKKKKYIYGCEPRW